MDYANSPSPMKAIGYIFLILQIKVYQQKRKIQVHTMQFLE